MTQSIPAIYEQGVFKPLAPVSLNDQELVSITITSNVSENALVDDSELARRQREGIMRFIEKMKSMPDNNPKDGLSNRDHDQILYGPLS